MLFRFAAPRMTGSRREEPKPSSDEGSRKVVAFTPLPAPLAAPAPLPAAAPRVGAPGRSVDTLVPANTEPLTAAALRAHDAAVAPASRSRAGAAAPSVATPEWSGACLRSPARVITRYHSEAPPCTTLRKSGFRAIFCGSEFRQCVPLIVKVRRFSVDDRSAMSRRSTIHCSTSVCVCVCV